jgi:hypothetical protein
LIKSFVGLDLWRNRKRKELWSPRLDLIHRNHEKKEENSLNIFSFFFFSCHRVFVVDLSTLIA